MKKKNPFTDFDLIEEEQQQHDDVIPTTTRSLFQLEQSSHETPDFHPIDNSIKKKNYFNYLKKSSSS